MTQVFHQLRTRSRALAQGLLLVLLATWLTAVCPHCLAQAGELSVGAIEASAMHCHAGAPPQSAAHDCCPQPPACTGGDCAQLSAVAPGEPLGALLPNLFAPAIVSTDFLRYAYPSTPPPAVPVTRTAVVVSCPHYLRNCSFLN